MSSVKRKLKMASFLAVKPHYWPELIRRLKVNTGKVLLPPPMGCSRTVAERWAKACAVPVGEACLRLGASPENTFEKEWPDQIRQAEALLRESKIEMGGGGSIGLLYSLCEAIQAESALETGVAYGFTSLAMLLSLRKRDGTLYSVDMPYPGHENTSYVGSVVPDELRSRWELYRYPDYIGLRKVFKEAAKFDIIHYDSDKSYEGRAWAYPLIWEHVRSGGLFVSDDIGDNTAFRDFSFDRNIEPLVAYAPGSGNSGERYVGILRKP